MPKNDYGARRKPPQPALTDNEQRLRFEPAFLDFYNELVRPNVELRVPAYIWKWKLTISKGAFVTYLRLRSMCFYDIQNRDNTRDWCWPKQPTLARELGIGTRALSDYLKELEDHQLIRRKANYEYDPQIRKRKRVEDTYIVPWELPLVPEDLAKYTKHYAAELIERTTQPVVEQEDGSTSKIRRQVVDRADITYLQKLQVGDPFGEDEPRPIGKNRSALSPAETAGHELVHELLPNVDQRLQNASRDQRPRRPALFQDPRVQPLSPKERERKDALAAEIGDVLKTMARDHSPLEHKSAGFHRLVAYLMPEEVVREALRITRDAVDDARAGQKSLGSPSAYFAGIVRNKAKEARVDLRLNWRSNGPPES